MWISSKRLLELVSEIGTLSNAAAELRRQLAVSQQNFDWLANHVNRLEVERAALTSRILAVGVPAPQIEKIAEAVNIVGGIPVQDRPEGEDVGMALAAMQGSSFEDMGDQAASLLGVTHDPKTGAVIYNK